ncbi:hypothetical protein NOVO_07375 [Rickettsiales bacterium Ac37b]|nr:hypothetical protein NOVO_07375 [Rickettsiales bacterium Ac37b]
MRIQSNQMTKDDLDQIGIAQERESNWFKAFD